MGCDNNEVVLCFLTDAGNDALCNGFVESGCGIIQNDDGIITIEGSRNRNALFLTTGQVCDTLFCIEMIG